MCGQGVEEMRSSEAGSKRRKELREVLKDTPAACATCTRLIPTAWSLRQEDCKLEVSLGNLVRPCLRIK